MKLNSFNPSFYQRNPGAFLYVSGFFVFQQLKALKYFITNLLPIQRKAVSLQT